MLRCFARIDSVGSCARPALVALISSCCDGTMQNHTLPVISVPISTPVCMYAARPLKNCENAKIAPNSISTEITVATRGLFSPTVRHSAS